MSIELPPSAPSPSAAVSQPLRSGTSCPVEFPTLGSQRERGRRRRDEGEDIRGGGGVWVQGVQPGGVQRVEAEDAEGGRIDQEKMDTIL